MYKVLQAPRESFWDKGIMWKLYLNYWYLGGIIGKELQGIGTLDSTDILFLSMSQHWFPNDWSSMTETSGSHYIWFWKSTALV